MNSISLLLECHLLTWSNVPLIDIRQIDQIGTNFQTTYTADVTLQCGCIQIGAQQIQRIIAANVQLEIFGGWRGGTVW